MLGKLGPWQQQLGESLAMVIGYMIVAVVTYASTWLANRSVVRRLHPGARNYRPLRLELEDTIEINVILDHTRRTLGPCALRTFMSVYHNGDDLGLRKKTRTHERTTPGVRYQDTRYQAMPISRVPEETALVLDAGVGWQVVAKLPECLFKEICEDGGARDGAVARVAVKVPQQKEPVAFVGADFRTAEQPEQIHELESCALAIGRILSRYH